jgi:hypothetical protein
MKEPPKLQAESRWQRVSRGEIDADLTQWLATVAQGLLGAMTEKNINRRRQMVLNAVGLNGKASLTQFAVAATADAISDPKNRAVMVGVVMGHHVGTRAELSPEAMRKRIARARKSAK